MKKIAALTLSLSLILCGCGTQAQPEPTPEPVPEPTNAPVYETYVVDGWAAKDVGTLSAESLDYAAGRFQYLYDAYLKDGNNTCYFTVVPDKSCYLAEKAGRDGVDITEFCQEASKRVDFAEFIDISDLLQLEDYYHTDIHWRQEKIVDVAQRVNEAMGSSCETEYETILALPTFYSASVNGIDGLKPEELNYLTNSTLESYKVFDYETNSEMNLYDLSKLEPQTPKDEAYDMFLGGSKSLISIDNPNADNDRELIIFRDSYGSSIAPLLATGYSRVTLVDIRYLVPQMLGKFLIFDGQDVLFLYSVPVLNNSSTIK